MYAAAETTRPKEDRSAVVRTTRSISAITMDRWDQATNGTLTTIASNINRLVVLSDAFLGEQDKMVRLL